MSAFKLKICPQCNFPSTSDTECDKCGVQFKHIKHKFSVDTVDRTCPFNYHGNVCGRAGSLSDGTLGTGPWYCSDHYWKLKGHPVKPDQKPQPSFRERWYEERGISYEQPVKPEQNIGAWTAMKEFGPRMRQPGED